MTEPTSPRPVPGLPRPGSRPVPSGAVPGPARAAGPGPDLRGPAGGTLPESAAHGSTPGAGADVSGAGLTNGQSSADQPFADLAQRPVVEHVAVFEAEHARLQRELGAIDAL